jgi:hypothetical protein
VRSYLKKLQVEGGSVLNGNSIIQEIQNRPTAQAVGAAAQSASLYLLPQQLA